MQEPIFKVPFGLQRHFHFKLTGFDLEESDLGQKSQLTNVPNTDLIPLSDKQEKSILDMLKEYEMDIRGRGPLSELDQLMNL